MSQPDAFVYECRYAGLDDVVLRTRPSAAEKAKSLAAQEIDEVLASFSDYMSGARGPWLVPVERLNGRLDAKYLRPWRATDLEPKWKKIGAKPHNLSALVDPVWNPISLEPNKEYAFLRITYEGHAEPGERSLGKEVNYGEMATALAGDIVVSNISAVYRAICVLPKAAEHLLISKEFTILRPKRDVMVDAAYLWAVLRSTAVVAEWLSGATGVGRHRVDWELLKDQRIPLLPQEDQKRIGNMYRKVEEYEGKIAEVRISAEVALAPLELEGEIAIDRLARAKPPK
jgi:hypothetical protein